LEREGIVRKLQTSLTLLLLIAGCLTAQRAKPVYDPETKDGLLIQHIQQETDPAERLRFMEQFVVQYPSHPAAAWVYDQLQPIYFSLKEWDQAIHIGTLRLAIEPENLEAGKIALRSVEAKQDPELTAKWADRVWRVASGIAAKGGPLAADARSTVSYAEFCLFSAAEHTADLHARIELLQALEQRDPESQYVRKLPVEYFEIYRQLGPEDKAAEMAEKLLQTNADNIDAIMFLAEYHYHKENPKEREKVIALTAKAIEILETKPRPESESESEWAKKKSQTLGMAYYIGGVSNGLNGNFKGADTLLRSALPYLKDPNMQAVAFYHLGMANYKLADKGGGPARSMDALKYMRLCSTIKSPFQAQAARNIETIKVEYNLK
jgi:tetratricopeptide (TPR) repeat protein